MRFLDQTFPDTPHNLACDEALYELCEGMGAEAIRFWEPSKYAVVLGYGNRAADEVNIEWCRARGVEIARRFSGGGTVLVGPGVLNYALALRIDRHPRLASIRGANALVLDTVARALSLELGRRVEPGGESDLTIGGRKIAGHAQRRGARAVFLHGSILLSLDIDRVQGALPMPSRQPAYRAGRPHAAFMMNLEKESRGLRMAILDAWQARQGLPDIPAARVEALVRDRYARDEWVFRR